MFKVTHASQKATRRYKHAYVSHNLARWRVWLTGGWNPSSVCRANSEVLPAVSCFFRVLSTTTLANVLAMLSMDSLPREILICITDKVKNVDTIMKKNQQCLKSLRLVNKIFAELAEAPLFKDLTIDVWINRASLQALTDIASHPYM